MTQTVSVNLGSVYNILSGIWGVLLEGHVVYAELMAMEWKRLTENARVSIGQTQDEPWDETGEGAGNKLLMTAVTPTTTLGPASRARQRTHGMCSGN